MIELLAPAKDKKCAKAAIDCGADAIYIGASEFGARKNAPNSIEDIEEIIQYAHKFNVKVFITLNTILTDEEILKAKELVEKLYEIGADAIIVQDMGFFELELPPIAIHMSTQCDNRSAEKVKFFEKIGASRVILARELSIEQIKEIKNQTDVELETFIHGALCVSYSGQCYLSQAIGGRSANKGECAQPCRKKYSLVDEEGNFIAKERHLLSLKDFNATRHIKELADAGVTSFKIEGRLKDENYVKNVVGYYRKLIDDLGLKKSSSGDISLGFEPDLDKSFNREFTNYFLDRAEAGALENSNAQRRLSRGSSTSDKIYSFNSPKSKGEYIGKVTKVGANYFEIADTAKSINAKDAIKISAQDGLCFYVGEKLSGCLVNKVDEVEAFRSGKFATQQKIFPYKMEGIKIGTEIYRNSDAQFEKLLKSAKNQRKIGVSLEFTLGKIKATDEDNNFTEIDYTFEEMAQNEDKMAENIINQLRKSGESEFLAEKIDITTEKIPFLPVSKLNELRRELFEKLMNERLKNYKLIRRPELQTPPAEAQAKLQDYPSSEVDYQANVLNKYAKEFYEKRGCKVNEMALESGIIPTEGKVVMTTKHCLKYAFKLCKSPKKIFLIDEKGKRYELKFDCENLCEMKVIF